jgi:hypothetical protein
MTRITLTLDVLSAIIAFGLYLYVAGVIGGGI